MSKNKKEFGENGFNEIGKLDGMRKMKMGNEEYIKSCFNDAFIHYSSSDAMRTEKQKHKKVKSRLWPNLSDMQRIKQSSTQKDLAKVIEEVYNIESPIGRKLINLNCVHLNFRERAYDYPWVDFLGHAIVNIIPMGDKSQCESLNSQSLTFAINSDEIIDGEIIAFEISDGRKRAFLRVQLKGGVKKYIIELKEFYTLSLVEKHENYEFGIMSVFNSDKGILYSEQLIGKPCLLNAKSSFGILDKLEWEDDNTVTTDVRDEDTNILENSPVEDINTEALNHAESDSMDTSIVADDVNKDNNDQSTS